MRAKRVDDNQREIVQALRKLGCSVAITSSQGCGFPDIVVGYRGINYLFELKDGKKVPSAQKITRHEEQFIDNWRGQVAVVNSLDNLLAILGQKL